METIKFRNEEVSCMYGWLDNDTFGFDFGDGEFVDSEGDDYFIHIEYHVTDNKWIVEIWWEDDNIDIEELDKIDADEYITEQEIREVKTLAEQLMK